MKQKLSSLRFRLLLPVIVVVLFVVTLLNTLFSRGYIDMILKQEQEVNTVSFATASNTLVPLIQASVSEVRGIMSDDRVASYARLSYDSEVDLVHARKSCRDCLRAEIASRERVYGLLFMRKDASLFGALPKANLFLDKPEENPLPEDMKTQILQVPLGQIAWVGPISGEVLCGFEDSSLPKRIMIAAWKSVDVSYGECYEMMLMEESVFEEFFSAIQDGKSTWYLFGEDQKEIWSTDKGVSPIPDQLLAESNSGNIFRDENGLSVCAFSMKMDSPAWTLIRKVPMDSYEQVVSNVRKTFSIVGGVVFLITLIAYELWLNKFLRKFYSLLAGIVRMGQGDLESTSFEKTSITEFVLMQQEIDRTRQALNQQMDTIRQMERENMELENKRKEQERIAKELLMAREIQANSLPSVFPPFPEREEMLLYASMTPAKEVGGDFYDFFLVDGNHLALVIADVSGKGIPAALFMMAAKTLINNHLMTGCDPATALERVNRQLCENNTSKMFVTVWLAVLNLSTGEGIACNAGHEHPALRRAGGDFELLKYRHGIFVGVSKKARYVNRPFEMHPGDCLFVYTDGLVEANNQEKKMFGEERVTQALNLDPDADPKTLIRNVGGRLGEFVQDTPQFDDVTMLALKYCGPRHGQVKETEKKRVP